VGAPLLGTLKDMYKRLWGRASLLRDSVLGNLGEGSSTGDFEMDEGGSVEESPPSLFEEAPWRGPGEEFLHWGRYKVLSEGRGVRAPARYGGRGRGGIRMPVTLMDE
jgi:hypothetical protein